MDGTQVLIGLGSNLGDRRAALARAVAAIAGFLRIEAVSPIYETAPQYVTDQPWFLNMALRGHAALAPRPLLQALKGVEARHGRRARQPNGPREIDLDILAYGCLVAEFGDLSLPHPRMTERAFVLAPLADIAPHWTHPLRRKTVAALLAELPETDEVVLLERAPPRE